MCSSVMLCSNYCCREKTSSILSVFDLLFLCPLFFFFFFNFKNLFGCAGLLGLSCGMWDLVL